MATARSAFWRRARTATGLTLAVCLSMPAVNAVASPQPDLSALQKQLRTLTTQVDTLTQQYDQSVETLKTAQKQLTVYQQQVIAQQATFKSLRLSVVQMAAAAYKNSADADTTGLGTLLQAQDPTTVLDQISVITAVSKDRGSKLAQYLAAAQRLQISQGEQQATVSKIKATQASITAQKSVLKTQIAAQARLVIAAGGPAPGAGTCGVIAANGRAAQAIRFACSKLGLAYLWGGTGPLYDCSGLTQAAWGSAGISLPRTTYDQWNAGSRVSYNQLQPGDLVFFDASLGHVGMYLGGGKMIHAPHTGDVVKISDISSGYYRYALQGGVHLGG